MPRKRYLSPLVSVMTDSRDATRSYAVKARSPRRPSAVHRPRAGAPARADRGRGGPPLPLRSPLTRACARADASGPRRGRRRRAEPTGSTGDAPGLPPRTRAPASGKILGTPAGAGSPTAGRTHARPSTGAAGQSRPGQSWGILIRGLTQPRRQIPRPGWMARNRGFCRLCQ